ncbi:MAG TPA: histidine phosphatase family protein [Planktothrix sp. UBA8407]|jgi:Fructose-2,6-bisphosphatase|nr:histidine phosphatase family protein [Planktothrix sp. UBA8402]HAO09862.1 histidine phosphatase family protein [Planktothrix sp. UBA8407]HBK22571.1 histidine phosphatase family protein [Planktothrix sp. UBA10369]
MKMVIVRHGEAEWNLQDRAMGQLDSPLTAKGIRQAYALGDRLGRLSFTTLYSSDLGRAAQTANIIASICDKKVIFDSELREWNLGIFQGLTIPEMHEKFPQERQDFERNDFEYLIPEGESLRQLKQRSFDVLTAIAQQHLEETVVVVTHGGILMCFFEEVLGIIHEKPLHFRQNHANFCAFESVNGRWNLMVWNDISHLENNEI